MSWYKSSQDNSQEIQVQLKRLVESLTSQFPGLDLYAFYSLTGNYIEISNIDLPPAMQSQGIGTIVVKRIQEFAQSIGEPIVIRPEANPGKKGALNRFYKNLGFVPNKGRSIDYQLSSPTSSTMYWKPSEGF